MRDVRARMKNESVFLLQDTDVIGLFDTGVYRSCTTPSNGIYSSWCRELTELIRNAICITCDDYKFSNEIRAAF